ncbi:hypothetical protein PHET_04218 [Paragonimus heterotremus]|uniref:Uncharacterized protein n=1 Tax=Paragonimus heterotremus TaxID=100268 RepID=A0A8J4WHN6_9TREM|nr:hypothetical protein PHET_04218 [Paragonimus heterotremus]
MPSSFGSINFELGTSWDSVLIDLHFRDSLDFKWHSACMAVQRGLANKIAVTCENERLWQSDVLTEHLDSERAVFAHYSSSSTSFDVSSQWHTIAIDLDVDGTKSDYKMFTSFVLYSVIGCALFLECD